MSTIKTKHADKQHVLYNDSLLKEPVECCFDPHYWQQQDKIVGTAQGRGTTWFIQTQQVIVALRHYHRGGLFGKLVHDYYLFCGWHRTRSYQEFQLLEHLIKMGVNVPRPVAARAIRRAFCYQADLISEKIPNAQDLVSILQHKPLSTLDYYNIGQQIRKMHQAQVNHTDLNIHNILLDQEGKVWIIDFDKCYQQSGSHWKDKNIERLKRSFIKEQRKRNIHWHLNEFDSLLIGYNA